jgi:hypothetical protein
MIKVQQLYNFLPFVRMVFIAVVYVLQVMMVPKKVRNHVLQYWQELHTGGSKINQ